MLILSDQNWVKAKYRVQALGHDEAANPERFEFLVRAAYEEERQRGHILIKGSGLKRRILMKAIGMEAPMPYKVKKNKTAAGVPMVTGWAQGQRPDQKAAVHGKIIAIGKDGMVIRDDRGRRHRIRHEHIMDHQPPLTEKEWPKAAKALADSGQKVDPISRFRKPERKPRPDAKMKRRLNTLGKKFKDLDVKRALKEATPEEVATLIEHYGSAPVPKKLKLKKSASIPYDHFDENDPEYLRHAPCMKCDHLHRLPEHVRSVGNEGHVWTDCRGHGGCQEHVRAEPIATEHSGDSVPDQLPEDIRHMKSQSVYHAKNARGVQFTFDRGMPGRSGGGGSFITRERPDRPKKTMGNYASGQIPFLLVNTPARPATKRLSEEEWDARKDRRPLENVRTRQGAYMAPTDSTRKRYRALAGNIKQQHNERERRG